VVSWIKERILFCAYRLNNVAHKSTNSIFKNWGIRDNEMQISEVSDTKFQQNLSNGLWNKHDQESLFTALYRPLLYKHAL
jgi:hypothetical protein